MHFQSLLFLKYSASFCSVPEPDPLCRLFQAATLGYTVLFCTMTLSPAVLLSFIRSSRQRDAGVGFLTNSALCVCVCLCLGGQVWYLCFVNRIQHSNLLFLLLQLYIFLCFPPFSVTNGSLSPDPLLPTSQREAASAAPLAAAESALMFCQASPASPLFCSLGLILRSLADTSHQVTTHSSTGDLLWHHTTTSIPFQINLIGPWVNASRKRHRREDDCITWPYTYSRASKT